MPYKLIPPGKRRNRYWVVRGTIGGVRLEETTGKADRHAAEQWAAEYVAAFARGGVPGRGAVAVGFEAAAQAFISTRKPSLDDERLVLRVAKWFGDRPLEEIGETLLVEAADALQPASKPATKNRKVITPASSVLHFAAEQGWCAYRRIRKLKVSKKSPRLPAKDETLALLIANVDATPTYKPHPHMPAMVDANADRKKLLLALLYETGMRIGEALALTWDCFDLQAGRVLVKSTKTDEHRRPPISPELVAFAANLVDRFPRPFPWNNRASVYRWLRPLCDRLGVHYTPHLSRHAFATWLSRAQVPDKQAAAYGWDDPRSLHRYQAVELEPLPRGIGGLSGVPAKKAG